MPTSLPTITVSQLTSRIKEHLEGIFPRLEIQGEISNFKRQSSGHLYFSLKDNTSQVPVVMFRGRAVTLTRLPRDGDMVILGGSISVYTPRGYYQVLAETLRFSGSGDLLWLVEQRKEKLRGLGWFDTSRKKKLPLIPQTIAVITSPTGSVIRDILHILARRFPGHSVLICPTRVQGDEAPRELAQGLALVNTHKLADVIILARGGGSIEDLMAFNSEQVAEAIHKSEIPVISAVGHETDTTISDLVADKRAPTPSAAAELVVLEKRVLAQELARTKRALLQPLLAQFTAQRQLLRALAKHQWLQDPAKVLNPFWQRIDDLQEQFQQTARAYFQHKRQLDERYRLALRNSSPKRLLDARQLSVSHLAQQLEVAIKATTKAKWARFVQLPKAIDQAAYHLLQRAQEQRDALGAARRLAISWKLQKMQRARNLQRLRQLLEARDPNRIIRRGYAIVYSGKELAKSEIRKPLTTVASAQKARLLTLQLSDGLLSAQVQP